MTGVAPGSSLRRWIVAIQGSRDYYSSARYLHTAGRLERLYTDLWFPPSIARPLSRVMPAVTGRWHAELADADVRADARGALLSRLKKGQSRYERWIDEGSHLAGRVARGLKGVDAAALGVLGYTGSSLEMMTAARERGMPGVHAQVDPGPIWYRRRDDELARWPGAEAASEALDPRYLARLEAELDAASRVLVNSRHAADSLVEQGVDRDKIFIVPLATREAVRPVPRAPRGDRPFRVLFVGSVTVAKGFPYFGQAARLVGAAAEFVAAGSMVLQPEFLALHDWPVTCTGHLSRDALAALMAESDVLVFPTLSDGFGLVQLEAMAAGLPVIATEHCGDVVEDGVSGFRIPARNAEAIANAVMALRDDPDRLAAMSIAAVRRMADFAPTVIGPQFIAALDAPAARAMHTPIIG